MQIVDRLSPNHDPRTGAVDMLILHYTGMVDQPAALARLTDPTAKVSAHYLIGEDGAIIRLVPEDRCAWHAGVSHWRSRADINGASIGIELVNPGHEFGYRDFPAAQMAALAELAKDIVARHKIPTRHVLGHSDVAIGRKQDPGERFDWRWLAQHGIGLWPDFAATPSTGNVAALQRDLAAFGYRCPMTGALDADTQAAVRAFQLHFRPTRVDGMADDETRARAAAVARAADV
ncbi:MAG: N-acetylmuramoyl-L-alanine amidase [Alphaproteobacteria bacterium]|jgi:N-acetylmuramoyl-L-alanine amidase|nr:N-acetylmuramoyl-L-alanine amidase [Alphaproteobacteria bacterium]